MPVYTHILPQDNVHHTRCKLHNLERKCFSKVEKLKSSLEHLHNGIPTSDLLEKTVSFFTLKKAFIFPNGYSRCIRDILQLVSSTTEDITPLMWQQ
ncbi:uncharacterized protein LOC143527897 [Brachyhypopomus gauderio]|uniref:uncharacterized protein LOC143527897 n=1 Tax=Brachyhypopomus gauderio TaxID=698409 RepID=UPI0040416E58